MNEFVDPFGESGAQAPQASESGAPQASDENPDPEDPDREQALRDRLGYSPTEKRTKAERDAAAQRMVATVPDAGDLPDDIRAIWGHSPEDVATIQALISAWGLEAVRNSQLHKAALQEARSAKERVANQKAFLDAQKRLKK